MQPRLSSLSLGTVKVMTSLFDEGTQPIGCHPAFGVDQDQELGRMDRLASRLPPLSLFIALWYRALISACGEARGIDREALVHGVVGKTYE